MKRSRSKTATPDGIKPAKVTYYINSIGMKLVRIEPGTFLMGLPDSFDQRRGTDQPAGGPMYMQHK